LLFETFRRVPYICNSVRAGASVDNIQTPAEAPAGLSRRPRSHAPICPRRKALLGFLYLHIIMTDLEWTDEAPEEEGFYWCRHRDAPDETADIASVEYFAEALRVVTDGSGYNPTVAEFDVEHKEWAGPIPEPTESPQDDTQSITHDAYTDYDSVDDYVDEVRGREVVG